jgi:hypothetical protein
MNKFRAKTTQKNYTWFINDLIIVKVGFGLRKMRTE